jgi:hypothetical protein
MESPVSFPFGNSSSCKKGIHLFAFESSRKALPIGSEKTAAKNRKTSVNFSNIDLKELASFIYESLKKAGIDVVLVGGACVSIYSQNRYQSSDLDFVTYEELRQIESVLKPLGFRRAGRCFTHDTCPYLLDFVNPPISIGNESIQHFKTLKTAFGSLQLLTPTDCVKDRLSSFFHWNDVQALEQAVLVAESHTIDLNNLKRWAKDEGHSDKLKKFLDALNARP